MGHEGLGPIHHVTITHNHLADYVFNTVLNLHNHKYVCTYSTTLFHWPKYVKSLLPLSYSLMCTFSLIQVQSPVVMCE